MADKFLFLHGWATDAWVWEETAKTLGAQYLNLCLPGHGGSLSWDGPTLSPAVEEIKNTLRKFNGEPIIAVGWSLGGQALLSFACENPKAFKALVLVGAGARFTAGGGFPHGQPRSLVKRMIMDMKKDPVETLRRFYALNFTDEELTLPGAKVFLERYKLADTMTSNRPAFKYDEITLALEALYKTDLRSGLSKLDLPCLIMHGTFDNVCPIEAGRHIAAHIKGARIVEFADAGHAPFITQPEKFNSALKTFLTRL
ncbi:MAG: alpha/beta fold hydrolase [Deltaproteobacteria bacterium]|nr:alpha/beta fold hydrolase [Deltaproteobacteria bacterium]